MHDPDSAGGDQQQAVRHVEDGHRNHRRHADQVTDGYKMTQFAGEKGKLAAKGGFTGNVVGGDPNDIIKKKVTARPARGPPLPLPRRRTSMCSPPAPS